MNHPSLYDEDQDSLFGSPPPSPARGRSPPQETFTPREVSGATPSTGVSGKNVGTIALPGSHMSCAELPANLPASGLPLPHSSSAAPPAIIHTLSRPSIPSVHSRASSTASTPPSSSSSTKKRKPRKSKSHALAPPPVTLPGPNEPTPPNFLRSQTSLLGLAGLVGSVKPARLHAHSPQPGPIARPPSPIRGSTPTHPIVLDDDLVTPQVGKPQISRLDQLNPEMLRSNMINSLVKEKNIFPVLESLIKLLGEEPQFPTALPPRRFARPYGQGIYNISTPASVTSTSAATTPTAPLLKRRKLKHVPAGAADWDVPFPFPAGEGPETYRNTWAQDRVKQLVIQLLELVQNASKRAAIRTARGGCKTSRRETKASSCQSSRSASVEVQSGGTSSDTNPEVGVPSDVTTMGSLSHFLDSLGTLSTTDSVDSGCKDRTSVDSPSAGAGPVDLCDNSAFEEWLSQLQQFIPPESNASTPESEWTRPSAPLNSSGSPAPARDPLAPSHAVRDDAIDPALLAISQQRSSTSSGDLRSHTPDMSLVPPLLVHSPRTSLSSLTEPLTPLSEASPDVPASRITGQDPGREPVEVDHRAEAQAFPLKEPSETPRFSTTDKGKARADVGVASVAQTVQSRSNAASTASASQASLDKQMVLERAQERRKELVAEIERAKIEIWTTSIENAMLVHFLREVLTVGSQKA